MASAHRKETYPHIATKRALRPKAGCVCGKSGATMCAWLRPSLRGRIALQLVPRLVNINIGQVGISIALQGELVHDAVVSEGCQSVIFGGRRKVRQATSSGVTSRMESGSVRCALLGIGATCLYLALHDRRTLRGSKSSICQRPRSVSMGDQRCVLFTFWNGKWSRLGTAGNSPRNLTAKAYAQAEANAVARAPGRLRNPV